MSHLRASATRGLLARAALVAIVASALTVGTWVAPPIAGAATWTVDTTTRTAADIRAMWNQLGPSYEGPAYLTPPSVKAPYTTGAVQPGFLADGLDMLNWGRYLAGLPYDVTLDATKNLDSQYGAVLLAASNFSHAPDKPADMDQAFYDRGLAAAGSSNLGWGQDDAEAFQIDCLDDSDTDNIDRLGHRRWILNPPMKKTGMGYAETRHVTYAFDRSRTDIVDYDAITWPSAGLFPVEFLGAQTAWSITLNPARFDWDATGQTVTLKRLFDGRTWTFTAADSNKSGEYFASNFEGYGIANVFVFRPSPGSIAYAPGNEFEITLSGGIYAQGTKTPTTVTYRTTFMSLTPPAAQSVYRFYNVKNGTHFYTPSTTERDTVISKWSSIYRYEGVAYGLDPSANIQPLYRFYNVKNGSHFYTASFAEAHRVYEELASVYRYEGETYKVNPVQAGSGTPVYRFYNKKAGTHFYTADPAEKASVQASLSHVYTYEGVAFLLGQ